MSHQSKPNPSSFDFWATKREIDAIVADLGWSKQQRIGHIYAAYGKTSRLQMTDEQLLDFLNFLHNLPDEQITTKRLKIGRRKRKGKRF